MKTCYGGHCYEYEDNNIVPSSFKTFLVAVVIAVTLFTTVVLFNEASIENYLTNVDFLSNEFLNSDFIP